MDNIAFMGMGAIGTVYGYLLHQKYGANFAVIAGGNRGEKLTTQGATLNNQAFFPRVIAPEEKGLQADLILVCVKNYQLDQAIADMRQLIG